MPRLAELSLAPFVVLSAALSLAGCGGSNPFPDTAPNTTQVNIGTINGNDAGGHAPIVAAHVYLLQAGTGGYGAKETSLLSASYSGSYATALNSTSGSPFNGMYYVTTDSLGNFSISGDYSCTVGDPVILYASGGNPQTTQAVNITGASAAPDAAGNLLITYTTTGNQLLYQGESVTFSTPFNPSNTAYEADAGTTRIVSPLNLTTTTFAHEEGQSSSTVAAASFTGTVSQAVVATNPAIANMVMLGVCPTPVPVALTGAYETDDVNGKLLVTFSNSGNNKFKAGEQVTFGTLPSPYDPFSGTTQTVSSLTLGTTYFSVELGTYSGSTSAAYFTAYVYPPANFGSNSPTPLNFLYINEVSTVAAAYAMAPFTAVSSTNNDSIHIGTSSTNLLGMQNAANNAGNLFNIQGALVGTGGDGDTHIAYATTPNGNGTVPQKLIDTVANILANCVDSANTYSAATATSGTQSTQCATLFNNATSDGTTTGTKPNDTATAAINIVTHPSGAPSNTSFVSNLYQSLSGNAPYQPSLGTQPNDFVVGIKYTGSMFNQPGECSADSLGNEWCADYGANTLTKLSPLGVVLYTFTVSGGPFHTMVDVANNVWVVSQTGNSVSEYTSAGVAVAGSPYTDGGAFSTPAGISNDGNGHTIVNNYGASNAIIITGSGTSATFATATTTCTSKDTTSAFDSLGYSWTSGGNANQACRISSNGTLAATVTGLSTPSSVDIDSSNRAWIPNNGNNTLAQITPTTTTPFYTLTTFSGGGMSGPGGESIDGLGNVWVANGTAYSGGSIYSVSEFTNAGVAITGTGGYQAGQLNYPRFVGMDISGDVWFSNFNGASVEELIGAGAPVVRPKATAVVNGTLGTRP